MDPAGRIKILRILNGFTQDAIAALLGTSRPSIVVWESGKHPPSTEYVIRLAEMVGVEPGYISYGSPQISCCAWIPVPPDRPQNFSRYIREIKLLFPSLLDENGLNAVRFSKLGDGSAMFLLGRDKDFSCLLLVKESLVDCFITIFKKRDAVQMGPFERVTIDKFGEDELTFIARFAAIDFRVNLDGIWNALVKARPGARLKDDALKLLKSAFHIVEQEYDIPCDDIWKVSEFFADKHKRLPPKHNISEAALEGEVRRFLESLGCRRKQ
jgi:transcriptional regulator with XRE-family HTH domain